MDLYYGCHVGSVLMSFSILTDLIERWGLKIASLFIFTELPLIWIMAPYSSSNISNSCYSPGLYLCLPLPPSKHIGFL